MAVMDEQALEAQDVAAFRASKKSFADGHRRPHRASPAAATVCWACTGNSGLESGELRLAMVADSASGSISKCKGKLV